MIPVFASIVVQMVELSVPKVWSLFLELVSSVVMRRIEVMQTLALVSGCHGCISGESLQASKSEN